MKKNHTIMFSARFAPKVEARTKRQTIRPPRKRPISPGDTVSLRAWTGKAYRSQQRVIGSGVVKSVRRIIIRDETIPFIIEDDGKNTRQFPLPDEFARADGFQHSWDMLTWFKDTHALPFEGILIEWEPTP